MMHMSLSRMRKTMTHLFQTTQNCKCDEKCISECNSCCLKVTNKPNEAEIPLASASTNLNRL